MTDDTVGFDPAEISAEQVTIDDTFDAGYATAMSIARGATDNLAAKAKALVDSVYADNSGNGDILSRETIAAADKLRLELARWK